MITKEFMGKYVINRFQDHCMGKAPVELELEAMGRVIAVTKKCVTIEYSTCIHPDPEVRKDNAEQYKIIQANIVDFDILEKFQFLDGDQ